MKDLIGLMGKAKDLQAKFETMQEEIAQIEISGQSGGGLVSVTLTGKFEMKALKIDPSLFKEDEIEILEDLIVAAHNDAKAKLEAEMQKRTSELTAGLPIPPGIEAAVLTMSEPTREWGEDESETYRSLSAFVVPERERQTEIIVALVEAAADGDMLDICCGEGLLARALLDAVPEGRVLAYDGSPSMLAETRRRCGEDPRLRTLVIDIAETGWRKFQRPLRAAVSSLAVHHLDAAGKRRLFADLHAALAPGGVFVLADVIRPATKAGDAVAARMWDEEVERRSLSLAGDRSGLEAFREADWNNFRHEKLDPIDKPSTIAEHLDWLREAGFADVDLHWMLAGQAIFSAWRR